MEKTMIFPVRRFLWLSVALLTVTLLSACPSPGDARGPIATELVPSVVAQRDRVLVIVLPGRGDDVARLRKVGIAEAVQKAWPEADVLLTGVTMAHYFSGRMPERLHDEVVAPARQRGYRQVWLLGASLGGMGTVLYDRRYPGEMDGLVLLAPYLGEHKLQDEITAAGGLAHWQPPMPAPEAINADNAQQEIWRHLKSWTDTRAARGHHVWLAYGDSDGLKSALPLLAPLLPEQHIFVRPGGHGWVVWTPVAGEIFSRIREEQVAAERAH
jgi:pimeloyl-ACP methyl ester carboxylesterase